MTVKIPMVPLGPTPTTGQFTSTQFSQQSTRFSQHQAHVWPPPYQSPSLDFTVDTVFAAVEKHLRKMIREELSKHEKTHTNEDMSK